MNDDTFLWVTIDGEKRKLSLRQDELDRLYLKTKSEQGFLSDGEGSPESPNHYARLKALTGVETWDILDFVAGDDPDMWNLGKYWFRMGHKEGQSTLTEKKKMLKYLERSIAKEEAAK